MRTTFEILFNDIIDDKNYPEATMYTRTSIVVDADTRYVICKGKGQISLQIKGEPKVYSNVWAVAPYVYNEG